MRRLSAFFARLAFLARICGTVLAGIAIWSSSNVAYADRLFATDFGNNIYQFMPDGTRSTFATVTSMATALAFDGSGNLFVAEYWSSSIDKFTPTGSRSTFATGVQVSGMTFDRSGNLFVTDEPGSLYEFRLRREQVHFRHRIISRVGIGIRQEW